MNLVLLILGLVNILYFFATFGVLNLFVGVLCLVTSAYAASQGVS